MFEPPSAEAEGGFFKLRHSVLLEERTEKLKNVEDLMFWKITVIVVLFVDLGFSAQGLAAGQYGERENSYQEMPTVNQAAEEPSAMQGSVEPGAEWAGIESMGYNNYYCRTIRVCSAYRCWWRRVCN